MNQLRFGPTSFPDDTELTEPISSFGPLTASGNITATIIKVNGPCTIGENLEIDTSLKVNGPLSIKGTLTCLGEATAKINGPVNVKKGIISGYIHINGPLSSRYIEVIKLSVNGPLQIEEDVVAEEEIVLGVGGSSRIRSGDYYDIGGMIEAPVVRISNFSSKYSASGIIKKIFGLKEKYLKTVVLEDLRIKAKLLELEGVELENCDLNQVDEIVSIRDD